MQGMRIPIQRGQILVIGFLVFLLACGGSEKTPQPGPTPVTPRDCAPTPASSLVVNVVDRGAKGDGVTDDSAAIQAAIDEVGGTGGTVLIPAGTFMVNATRSSGQGLMITSHMTLQLDPSAVLKVLPNGSPSYSILYLEEVSDVNILGGTLEGDRSTHTGTGGESGMGIVVASSTSIVIESVTVKECWGDGFYIGGSTPSQGITLCSVVADHNRRQGLSVVMADGVVVRNSTFQNTSGTTPENGIDIEPNPGETVNNLQILNCIFSNNAGGGIQDSVPIANTGIAFATNIVIEGNHVTGNGVNSANGDARGGIEVSNVSGHRIANNIIQNNNGWGLRLRDNANDTVVTGNTVSDSIGDGIWVGAPCMGFTLTNNAGTGNTGHGIRLDTGVVGTVSGNTVTGQIP